MKFRWPWARSGRKDTQSRVMISMQNTGPYVPTPRDYTSFAREAYQLNVIANRSISMIATNGASIPWVLYKKAKSKGAKRTEILDHPFLTLIGRPNPMQCQAEFLEAVLAFKFIAGNSYIQAVGPMADAMAKVKELWPLRPDRMKIVPGPRGYPAAFIYKLNDKEYRMPVDQVKLSSPVLHWKFFNPVDDWYGMSPIESIVYGIDTHSGAARWNLSLLQNSARPSGAFVAQVTATSSGIMSEEGYRRLKEQLAEQYEGASNAGRPMLLEGGLDWKQLSMTPQQMEHLETKNTSARDIALGFGVPPQLLGIPGDNTYSNYEQARVALYEETILPVMDSLKASFNHWLLPTFGDGIEAALDHDAVQALAPRRMILWDKVQQASWLTVNEKREATGYDEIGDEGDVILVPSTNIPLEDAVAGPEPVDGDPNAPVPGKKPAGSAGGGQDDDSEDDQGDTPRKSLKAVSHAREGKVFNLTSNAAKQREARGQDRMKAGFKRRLLRQAQACFDIEGHRVKEAIEGLDAHHAEFAAKRAIEANRAQWQTVLTKNAQAVMEAFGERVFRSMKAEDGAFEKKDAQSKYEAFLKKWIADHVGESVDQIEGTSRDEVVDAIRAAQTETWDEGEGVTSLAEKIQDIYDGFTKSRSMTIARTETGMAANTALRAAAKSTSVPGLEKEWVPVNDDRTRDDHAEMAGMSVPIDEKFDVHGSHMDGPGDPEGDPSEVINCRCGQVFKRAKSQSEESEE